MSEPLEELWNLARSVPEGMVASYGMLGRSMRHPMSGRQVGFSMARCPSDVPWWRIVAQTGQLVVHKRNPLLAAEQRARLEAEGVRFEGDLVAPEHFCDPNLLV
jgi:methylated-DNA-protein-cysteine methyltransferase-like protein